MIFRRSILGATAALMMMLNVPHVCSDEVRVPQFTNQKERIPLPSLTSLTRVRFITTIDFPPFNSLDSAGNVAGFNIDLAKALCDQLNISSLCQIEAVPWNELEQKLTKGEGEAIIAGLTPTEENRTELAFTQPYMRLPARFLASKQNAANAPAKAISEGKPIGVIGDTLHAGILRAYFPSTQITSFENRSVMLNALKANKIYAIFDDGLALATWLNENGNDSCCALMEGAIFAPDSNIGTLRIAVTQKNAHLAAAFDNALQALERRGIMSELYLRYFPISIY